MATVYFQPPAGTSSADWGTASNWSAAPTNGDDIMVLDGAYAIVKSTTTYDAVAPARVVVSSGFKGTFGTPGTPIKFGNITSLEWSGSGGAGYVHSTGTVAFARVAGTGGGRLNLVSGGTVTKLAMLLGDCEVSADVTLTYVRQLAGMLKVVSSANAITEAIILGGNYEAERNHTLLEVCGPSAVAKIIGSKTITTARLSGGMLRHWSTGTITKLDGIAGRISSRGAYKAFAVTDAELWKGFQVEDGGEVRLITFTNTPQYLGYSGGEAFR